MDGRVGRRATRAPRLRRSRRSGTADAPELDRRGHREGRDAGPDREKTEQVPLAVAGHEVPADPQVRQGDEDQERAAVRREVAAQEGERRPR